MEGGRGRQRVCGGCMCEREILHGSEGGGKKFVFNTLNHDGYIRAAMEEGGGGVAVRQRENVKERGPA